jgi:hypothetical protein
MRTTLTALLFAIALCVPAIAQDSSQMTWGTAGFKGNDIISPCKQAVTDLDENSSTWQDGATNAYYVGLCKGMVAGVTSGLHVSEVNLKETDLNQLIRVVAKYLGDHPELLDRNAGWLIRQALIKAFPPQK